MNRANILEGGDWNEEAYALLLQLLYGMMEDDSLHSIARNPQARIQEYSDMTAQLSSLRHLFAADPGEHAQALSQKMDEAHLLLIRDLNVLKKQNSSLSRWNHLVRQRIASVIARNTF
jgi:hypothetical protein